MLIAELRVLFTGGPRGREVMQSFVEASWLCSAVVKDGRTGELMCLFLCVPFFFLARRTDSEGEEYLFLFYCTYQADVLGDFHSSKSFSLLLYFNSPNNK